MSAGLSTAAIVGIGAVAAGAAAGAMGNHSSSDNQSGIDLGPESAWQSNYLNTTGNQFNALNNMVGAGPGQQDVTKSYNSSQNLASLLGQYSQSGGLPTQADINTTNGLASNVFAPQQTALNQSFVLQQQQANRLAAQLGRSPDDPVLQAKLRTGFMNQQAQLNANQGAWATQQAMALPGQRLNYANQQNQVLGNLATQAMQNRTALLNIGSQLGAQERQWQLNTGTRWSNGSSSSGGGLGGAITGGLGGLGTAMSMGASGLFSGGGLGSGGAMMSDSFQMPSFSAYAPPPMMANPYGAGNIPSASSFSMPSFGSSFSSYQPTQPSLGFGGSLY